jgi:hypothetical protein
MASSVQLGIGAFVIRPTQALAAGGRVSEKCRKAVGRERSASSYSGLGSTAQARARRRAAGRSKRRENSRLWQVPMEGHEQRHGFQGMLPTCNAGLGNAQQSKTHTLEKNEAMARSGGSGTDGKRKGSASRDADRSEDVNVSLKASMGGRGAGESGVERLESRSTLGVRVAQRAQARRSIHSQSTHPRRHVFSQPSCSD